MIEGLDFDALYLLIIERTALTATPGPWASDEWQHVVATQSDQLNGGYAIAECHGPSKRENMAYLAAANPRAVLELIRRLRGAEQRCAELENKLSDVSDGFSALNDAITFAIKQGLEAANFLSCWQEGDWDGCREFGFTEEAIATAKGGAA